MLTLEQIALKVKGKVVGDSSVQITSVDDITEASEGSITFSFLPKYQKKMSSSKASAFVSDSEKGLAGYNGIVVEQPYLAMITILTLFSKNKDLKHAIHPNAVISESATIDSDVTVGPFSVIGDNVTIKSGTIIGSQVVIYNDVQIGQDCLIHSGAIIGADGFGFATIDNKHHKIPHIKSVIIGDMVEIGANCTIDKGSVKNTVIKDSCKMDDQVHIAHNVTVEEGCLISGGTFLGGSVTIGAYSMLGGKVDIGPHVILGEKSIVAARSVVLKSVKGNQMYAGNPAREIKEKQKRDAVFTKVEILEKRLKKLIKE